MKASCISFFLCCATTVFAEEKPNFVWIISEDNSKHHQKHFDPSGIATPNIEALAKDGVTFDAACSNAPVCSVARTTLLTGCYAPRIGAQYHRKQKIVPMPNGLKPFPFYLKKAGYYTANSGKTDYNVAIDFKTTWSGKKDWKARKPGQPFFFQLSSLAQSHEGSGHFKAAVMSSNPLTELTKTVSLPPHHPDTLTMRYSYVAYQKRMLVIDEKVGSVIRKLKADGVYDNTIVFYFGDHGGILPRSKGYAYETGLNPPLVIRFPDKWKHLVPFEKGSRSNANINFYDFGPSLINAAGITVNPAFDGSPFLGKNISADSLEQRPAFGYADRFDEKYDLVRTLRKGNLKYMRSYQPFNPDALHSFYRYKSLAYIELRELYRAGKLDPQQSFFFQRRAPETLYDLSNDPYEVNNLATDPAFAPQLNAMRKELSVHLKKENDLSFFPESYLIKKAFANPVAFGQTQSQQIRDLIDIADLQLQSYANASPKINQALQSNNPWKRYWACIAAATFAEQDQLAIITELAKADPNKLVRVRAGEYLALVGKTQLGIDTISKAAMETEDPVELNLILNSAAMVYEMDPKNNLFNLPASKLKTNSKLAKERISYLTNGK